MASSKMTKTEKSVFIKRSVSGVLYLLVGLVIAGLLDYYVILRDGMGTKPISLLAVQLAALGYFAIKSLTPDLLVLARAEKELIVGTVEKKQTGFRSCHFVIEGVEYTVSEKLYEKVETGERVSFWSTVRGNHFLGE